MQQGHYWDMHDQLFETQSRDREELLSLAGSLGIDSDDFIECLENRSVADRIRVITESGV